MKKTLSLLFILFTTFLFAEEEIIVHLPCSSSLETLYLEPFKSESSGFSESYVKELEKVLTFDLHHNGKTQVVKQKSATYKVSVTLIDKKISAFGVASGQSNRKAIENVPLNGSLASDRRKIHQVADALFEAFFGKKGIASSRILYTVRTKLKKESDSWETEIFECDYDGANARQLTDEGKLSITPSYIANHSKPKNYLYVSYKTGQPKICLGALQGGNGKRVSFLRGNQLMPTFSSKKNLLAFVSDITGNPELFVQHFDETHGLKDKPWQITSFPGGAQGSPTFSPDGSKLAFVSNKDGKARIYITQIPKPEASAKELHLQLISKQNRENTSPAWSPDGEKIAYSAMTKGVRQIWVYDLKSKKEFQITDGTGHKESPSWAPDSEHIVFHSSTNQTSEIHFIGLSQKEAVKITGGKGEKRFPSWEPFSS